MVKAFTAFGIDASSNERTTEDKFRAKIEAWHSLSNPTDVSAEMVRLNQSGVTDFLSSLVQSVSRHVKQMLILPLHGSQSQLKTIEDAVVFLQAYDEQTANLVLLNGVVARIRKEGKND